MNEWTQLVGRMDGRMNGQNVKRIAVVTDTYTHTHMHIAHTPTIVRHSHILSFRITTQQLTVFRRNSFTCFPFHNFGVKQYHDNWTSRPADLQQKRHMHITNQVCVPVSVRDVYLYFCNMRGKVYIREPHSCPHLIRTFSIRNILEKCWQNQFFNFEAHFKTTRWTCSVENCLSFGFAMLVITYFLKILIR